MRTRYMIALIAIALVVFAGSAVAQKKTTTKKTTTKKTTTAKTVPPLDVRAAREKVDIQLDNVSRFIDVLGPIAQAIEDLDAAAKVKPLSKAAAEKNETNKQNVIGAIRNLRTGLTDLESEFRTKTALQKYLPNIKGITDLASEAEDSAIAGKFVAAKDPLRDVVMILTDTLSVLPK